MKISYKKKYLRGNLIMGPIWLLWFLIGAFTKDELHWMDFGWIVISAMYIGLYLYHRQKQYLSIENGTIRVHSLFGKKMELSEIMWIRRFAGDYTLKSENKAIKINTQIIDPDSLVKLNAELEKLGLERK